MKKLLVSVLVLFVLCGATVFAQESDDDFVDVGEKLDLEASVGFQWNMTMNFNADEVKPEMGPSIALSWRQYMMPLNETMKVGYSVVAAATFISKMDWAGIEITSDMGTLMNIGLIMGGSLQGSFGEDSPLGFVADAGLAALADTSSFEYLISGTRYRYELMNFAFGLGINAGIQYRMPFLDEYQLIFEFGANLAYYFMRMDTYDYYVNDTLHTSLSGNNETISVMRAAPYFVVGFKY